VVGDGDEKPRERTLGDGFLQDGKGGGEEVVLLLKGLEQRQCIV
jgi:hypothetical protein